MYESYASYPTYTYLPQNTKRHEAPDDFIQEMHKALQAVQLCPQTAEAMKIRCA
jgi:hypothetical protein